jgi:hypothetical protein
VPEITAVSNPKRRPPRAPTIALRMRMEFSFNECPPEHLPRGTELSESLAVFLRWHR